MKRLEQEIQRRRTFAIVSHPDAGKTTLTEKLLLFGGAIREAGAVKSNKIRRGATSDFMEIERQRGISVATSVMGFEYKEKKINILDTPGHQDFAEDTFRTLTAADSVVVVIDAAKGVERQTEKLVKVCKMRRTPMMVFINKLDREGKDAFELLDELEEKLEIKVKPLTWNIGMGVDFQGIFDLQNLRFLRFNSKDKQHAEIADSVNFSDEEAMKKTIGERAYDALCEEKEIIETVYPEFEKDEYLNGDICPVFFGSALNNFGVQELLDCFVDIAPWPTPQAAKERFVQPTEEAFTGFVFKIHANMDPKHRDRIAFVKVCSGMFKRNNTYKHVRLNRTFKYSNPTAFMASKKSVIDEAYPGDIVGLHDTGNLKIGDTLTEGEVLHFKGLPSFSPEMFKFIENANPMKTKQLVKGIDHLMDEGVAQLFVLNANGRKIIGTVGALQYEVIEYRLKNEYNASCRYEPVNVYKACWVSGNEDKLADLKKQKAHAMAKDKLQRDVFLAESAFILEMTRKNYPDLTFHFTSELQG